MVGAILAGGAGRRLGGTKPGREVAGRSLAAYVADALAGVAGIVAIVGKRGQDLPVLPGVQVWNGEPLEPRHPAAGIAYALERAREPALVCAADMPFVRQDDCRALVAAAEAAGGAATRTAIAAAGADLQPLLAVYAPDAAGALKRGALGGQPMRALAAALDPVRVQLPDAALRSVNTPDELAAADEELRQPRSIT